MAKLISRWLRRQPRPVPVLPSVAAYAQWAEHYPPEAHNALMQLEQATMTRLLPDLAGRVVLDLASGTGRYGLVAQALGARTVLALDNSHAMLTRNALPWRALASTEALPLPAHSVDVMLCGLALGHLPQLQPSLREMGRVLRPGGAALVSDLHPFVALSGGQRTFPGSNGQTLAVEHYVHLYTDYQQTGAAAGLTLTSVAEPRLDPAGPPIVIIFQYEKR